MTKAILHDKQCLLFDGAMGTMLQQAGLAAGELPELWNVLRPESVVAVHASYLAAGAEILCTNTFQASELKLAATGYTVDAVIHAGVNLARTAGAKLVALAIGPLPSMLKPLGNLTFAAAYQLYRQQVLAGVQAGADALLIETQSDLYEAKAAILAAKENSALPVFCTLTFQADGRTFLGTDPVTAVQVLQGLGVDCLGANCSLGPKELLPLVKEMAACARVPLLVQANAGLPKSEAGNTVFPVGPAEFAAWAVKFAELGVSAIGGCCGTTPAHITAIKSALADATPRITSPQTFTCACSPTETIVLGRGTLIGERLNPTGNKELKDALRVGNLQPLLALAIAQAEAGAQLLDLNVGLPGIDEAAVLAAAVEAIQAVVDTPLVLDSANPAALAAAARAYNGKPIINSVNGTADSMAAVLPLVKKYGAAVIGLTIDEQGIPASAEARLAIARKILRGAAEIGIPRQDIIIDCLTLTAAAQPQQAQETLKALGLIRAELGLATVLGISNISHGLPRRERLNSVFLIQALSAGLDAAISDPLAPAISHAYGAWRVLSGQDRHAADYIQAAQQSPPPLLPEPIGQRSLPELITSGDREGTEALVTTLAQKYSAQEIIDNSLVPALTAVGREYDQGKIFLPQLLRSAEAVQAGLGVLKRTGNPLRPTRGEIILATVQGDIHDIGKNIVKFLLENHGFSVIDLGKDVPVAAIVSAAREHQATLVGLSALMTTTVANMALTIKALKEQIPHCQVLVGGAVLTAGYAKQIGADFYAPDALAGVRIASQFFANAPCQQ